MNRRKFIGASAGIGSVARWAAAPTESLQRGESTPEPALAEIKPLSKMFLAKAQYHRGECYGPVISAAGSHAAFLRVRGETEELVLRPLSGGKEQIVAADTYLLTPEFCGEDLFWVVLEGEDWRIKRLALGSKEVDKPFSHWGRPIHLRGCPGGRYLVWEERLGKRTRLYLSVTTSDRPALCRQIPVAGNAYDPVCTQGNDGILYVAYGAFGREGYQVYLQKYSPDGHVLGQAVRITHGADSSLYPSLAPHSEQGVWISYTKYLLPFDFQDWDIPYVEHPRRKAQHAFFQSRGLVHVGYFDGDRLLAPYAPPKAGQLNGGVAAMLAFGTEGAGRSQVLTDGTGRVRLLFRTHRNQSTVTFGREDTLSRSDQKIGADNTHPALFVGTLLDGRWSEPTALVGHAHFDDQISVGWLDGGWRIAFAEDGRRVGWGQQGEWFDRQHEVGVGLIELNWNELPAPKYDFRPYVVKPAVSSLLEEPVFPHRGDDGAVHAKGQTHKHTNHSVCTRAYDGDHHANFRFLQDVMHCDFGAITDHSYNFWQTEILYMNKMAAYYYFPGEFVALPGYEWTSPKGHINPMFFEEKGFFPVFQPQDGDAPGGTFASLWRQYEGRKVLAPPHHTADAMLSFDWAHYHARFMPVAEVFQDNRGSCEQLGVAGVTNYLHTNEKRWVTDQLAVGRRLGMVASADHVGVAQAFAVVRELTRTALYEAFCQKRVFGSTGISLHLDFTVNGQPMGSEVNASEVNFLLRLKAPEVLSEVQVTRDGKEFKTILCHGQEHEVSWRIQRQRTGEYWFCRVLLANGEMAWSSPIWIL